MRAQSSIEFLTTYGFMFIIIGIVISVLAFISVSPITYSASQCNAFSGPSCVTAQLYSNTSQHYSLVTLVLTNSEAVPVNISNISVSIRGISSTGTCTPLYLVPGQSAVCVAKLGFAPSLGTYLQGFYALNGKYCNAGISGLASSNCTYSNISYSGSFEAAAEPKEYVAISMLALQSNKTMQLPPYRTSPVTPSGYPVIQNGYFATNITNGILEYAFGTPGYLGNVYLGEKVVPFPQSVSSLNNAHVDCGSPYNSTFSAFATTLYMPKPYVLNVSIVTDDAMEVYYKPQTSTTWSSVFSGAAWHGQGATQYTNNDVIVSGGTLYNIEILWSNVCGPGVQVLKISNMT